MASSSIFKHVHTLQVSNAFFKYFVFGYGVNVLMEIGYKFLIEVKIYVSNHFFMIDK